MRRCLLAGLLTAIVLVPALPRVGASAPAVKPAATHSLASSTSINDHPASWDPNSGGRVQRAIRSLVVIAATAMTAIGSIGAVATNAVRLSASAPAATSGLASVRLMNYYPSRHSW